MARTFEDQWEEIKGHFPDMETKTFEEQWNAIKACGARAIFHGRYFPKANERMSQYQKSLLIKVQLPKSKSSNPHAELMFCDSQILNRDSVCVGFTYCTQYHDPSGQRFWYCDECGEYYKTNIKEKPWEWALDPNEYECIEKK